MQFFLVGGALRDRLLHLNIKDRDHVVINATPKMLLDLGYKQVGKDFPVFLHPKTGEEYALARTERKNGQGYHGFECYAGQDVSLVEDLQRRDLTINAMACSTDGYIIDPYKGQEDLKNKILRHVSPAFSEDPLRVLRVARFAARFYHLGFKIAPETLLLMRKLSISGELTHLRAERIWQETDKALASDDPQIYFSILRECGALNILFPEIARLFGIPGPKRWHPEIDTGIHTLMVLKQATKLSNDNAFRFACLVHDLGKALTLQELWPSHKGHGELGLKIINSLCTRLKIPNEYRELALLVSQHHTFIHKAPQLEAHNLLNIMDKCDAWRKPSRFLQMLECCIADAKGRLGFEQTEYPSADHVWQAFLVAQKVNVQDILAQGFKGKEIKEALLIARIKAVEKHRNKH
ncbi:multifunctional CCA addition/repair protein [Psychromonas sp. CD1]|uniref:multifunctional CCA addition/repair protein n=1 Tax=Psychromonas sp. CD1 TaxID=1979839 RepID=UPI000B9A6DCF|nr:multifunctional CCA addition/repair protein [Psychromonas sp. CD1]